MPYCTYYPDVRIPKELDGYNVNTTTDKEEEVYVQLMTAATEMSVQYVMSNAQMLQ